MKAIIALILFLLVWKLFGFIAALIGALVGLGVLVWIANEFMKSWEAVARR